MNKIGSAILVIYILSITRIFGAAISGKITIDSSWNPVIYLSYIESFDELNTASYHFLIAQTDIDKHGKFLFDSLSLPADDHLYRLHICKKGDPISTIIIGGKEQNHLHFVTNDLSKINIEIESFYDFEVLGHSANYSLQELFNIKKQIHAPLDIPSEQNRALQRRKILDQFASFVDTSNYVINRLLAAHFIEESFGLSEQLVLFEKLDDDLTQKGDSSPYFQSFQNNLSFFKFNREEQIGEIKSNWFLYVLALSSVLFFTFWVFVKRKRKGTINLLSIQEKKIYNLLKMGKSNKEISSDLHIEVSTVKSHVYNIYSKLGVKSRKEIVR